MIIDQKISLSDDGIPILTEKQQCMLLHMLKIEDPLKCNLDNLCLLQWSFLKASPFHNIDLLAGRVGENFPLTSVEALENVLKGKGGPCHVQNSSFLALLRSLGYRAHLGAATIKNFSDHLVIVVHLDNQTYICDVGNGHPYHQPFFVCSKQKQNKFGWEFASEPHKNGIRLHRLISGFWKVVYYVDLAKKTYYDFSQIIYSHHNQKDFGPFLSGLRAVRIRENKILTLRNNLYQEYTESGVREKIITNRYDCTKLLYNSFEMRDLPIEKALAYLDFDGTYFLRNHHH